MTILRSLSVATGTLLAAFLLAAAPAQAQDFSREGFFIGFGFGFGSLGVDDASDRESSVAAHLKLGGAVSDRFLLGIESNGWYKDEAGAQLTFSNLSAVGQFYPSQTSNFFLKAGVGVARAELDLGLFGSGSETGLGLVAGAGIDIPAGSRFALTPFANFNWGDIDGTSVNVFEVGLALYWY